jgi:drug/metabolite transporter (DMT)-like permease
MAYGIGSLGEVPQIRSGVGGVVTLAGVLLVNSRGRQR